METTENIQVGVSDLAYFLLIPGEEAINILSFAEQARDELGYSWFAVIETSRGTAVVDAALWRGGAKESHTVAGSYRVLEREAIEERSP